MTGKKLFALWGVLFVICAGLGFVPLKGELSGTVQGLLTAVSVVFFVPPAVLVYRRFFSGVCPGRYALCGESSPRAQTGNGGCRHDLSAGGGIVFYFLWWIDMRKLLLCCFFLLSDIDNWCC